MLGRIRGLLCLIGGALVWEANGDTYAVGAAGDSCAVTCGGLGFSCLDHIVTNNSTQIFKQLGVNCVADTQPWWAPDQPAYISDPSDPNYGKCLGYVAVPSRVDCQGRFIASRRLCHCGEDVTQLLHFGTGYSGGSVGPNETKIFSHILPPGRSAAMTHFWTTAPDKVLVDTVFRYYVDGEAASMAAGVGFSDDSSAPFGTKWSGLGAGNGKGAAWFHNYRIPFTKSIVVTTQRVSGVAGGFYMIVRGELDAVINIGGVAVPASAKLKLYKVERSVKPLEFIDVSSVPSGSGLHFMHTLAVTSGNLNFLEGCYHAYTPFNQSFPGTLLSTGTEDYYDSGWYFNAGRFYFPVSGFTHLNDSTQNLTWSAYRFHEMDPLTFNGGFRLQWRNGDMDDPATGLKCYVPDGADGRVVGNPTVSFVNSYSWDYVW